MEPKYLVWKSGAGYTLLTPPPLAQSPFPPAVPLSFHATSGMYPSAEPCEEGSDLLDQYCLGDAPSLNSVPPTHVLWGEEHKALTPASEVAWSAPAGSHPAAPLSPDETSTLMPCAAACCQRALMCLFNVSLTCSQTPKLMLSSGARLF